MQASALTALGYGFAAMPYALALTLGLLVPMLGVLSYSTFSVGVAVVVGMFAIEALYMFVGAISLGISIFYTDFALVLVCGVGLLRLLMSKARPPLNRAWLVFCMVTVLSAVLGLATYGTGAGVQARPYFYFAAAAVYAMSFRIDDKQIRLVLGALVGVALLLLCICAYRWVVYYTPIPELLPPEGAYNNDGAIRVIRSHEALVLAQVLVAGLFFVRASGALSLARAVSPLLLAAVVVLQHRSVWLTALAGVLFSLYLGRQQRGSAVGQALLLAAIVATTALPMVLSDRLSGVSAQITSSADAALQERGSAGERLASWREIINNWAAAGPRSIAIGQSFGTDPTRYVRDETGGLRKLEYTAHNMYVQTLFNTGLIGLGAFLLAAACVVRGLYRLCASGRGGAPTRALLALVVMQLVYYVPYGTDYLQSLIFGVALAHVASQSAGDATPADIARRGRPKLRGWGWT